jgi:phosphohistidine swiveling domain-containing protein
LARRVETHGVVATSLLAGDDADDAAVPTGVVRGVVAVAGDAHGTITALDRGAGVGGVVVTAALALGDLPLLAVADAVVAERGAPLSPTCHALRRLGIPVVVEAAFATAAFSDGEHVTVGRGVARRSSPDEISQPSWSAPPPASLAVMPGVMISSFDGVGTAADAEARGRRPERPGDISGELAAPPAGGLHDAGGRALPLPPHTLSADGEPVHDDDVVDEEHLR